MSFELHKVIIPTATMSLFIVIGILKGAIPKDAGTAIISLTFEIALCWYALSAACNSSEDDEIAHKINQQDAIEQQISINEAHKINEEWANSI
jgi:hypothetical protein